MALVASVDGAARRIYLSIDSVGVDVHPIDIYKEVRALLRTNTALRKFYPFITAAGNIPKTDDTSTERYVTLLDGCRIVPYDTSHNLRIVGVLITDEATEGRDCFDRTPLSPTTVVDVDYQPPQVEIVNVNTGSGVTSGDITAIRNQVVAGIYAEDVEGGEAFRQLLRLLRSAMIGDVEPDGSDTLFKSKAGATRFRTTPVIDGGGKVVGRTVSEVSGV